MLFLGIFWAITSLEIIFLDPKSKNRFFLPAWWGGPVFSVFVYVPMALYGLKGGVNEE